MTSSAELGAKLQGLSEHLADRLRTDDSTLAKVSSNYGSTHRLRPAALLAPNSAAEATELVDWARRSSVRLVVRGRGHSQGTQNLRSGAVVVDTSSLVEIPEPDLATRCVTVGAGATWGDLITRLASSGLIPPVLTDNQDVTIGGTLSVAGVGPNSFGSGSQAHHCLGLEIVDGTGRLLWLDANHEPLAFDYVRGGLGQFGVITKARLHLKERPRCVLTARAAFENLPAFLAAVATLFKWQLEGRIGQDFSVEGCAEPTGSAGSNRTHRFVLDLARESRSSDEGLLPSALELGELTDQAVWDPTDYAFRMRDVFKSPRYSSEGKSLHPWVEHLMPLNSVAKYLESALPLLHDTPVLLWPMNGARLRRRGFAVPDGNELMLVGIMAAITHEQWPAAQPIFQQLSRQGIALGGKRYLSGWLNFDHKDWTRHFGTEWAERETIRKRLDPDGILSDA